MRVIYSIQFFCINYSTATWSTIGLELWPLGPLRDEIRRTVGRDRLAYASRTLMALVYATSSDVAILIMTSMVLKQETYPAMVSLLIIHTHAMTNDMSNAGTVNCKFALGTGTRRVQPQPPASSLSFTLLKMNLKQQETLHLGESIGSLRLMAVRLGTRCIVAHKTPN